MVARKSDPVGASQEFAQKVRNLASSGKLDWLLSEEGDSSEVEVAPRSTDPIVADRHYRNLVEPLFGLREVLPLGIHDPDIAIWFIRPEVSNWPVTKGRAHREGNKVIDVKLDAEAASEAAFGLLRQHLPDDPIWQAIEDWKEAMGRDLSARFDLLGKVVRHIESPVEVGGLGLPVGERQEQRTRSGPLAEIYLAFSVYDRILTAAMNLNHKFSDRDRVQTIPPDITAIAGYEILWSDPEEDRQRAIDFLFGGWKEVDWGDEIDLLAEAYKAAEKMSDSLKRQTKTLELRPGFSPESSCELCR